MSILKRIWNAAMAPKAVMSNKM